MSLLPIYKRIGQTPLELVKEVKSNHNINEKISYLGRLDPMAHGLMVLLVGSETKNQEKYQKLDKVYEYKVLFGVETDTYDMLGLMKYNNLDNINKTDIEDYLYKTLGESVQKFPPYSSIKVNGKPLWFWAKEGKLDSIRIPEKKINIYSSELIDFKVINSEEILKIVNKNISSLDPNLDFRQQDILKKWNTLKKGKYYIATIRSKVSTGTYVRDIAQTMGKYFNSKAIAFDIKRTQVGDFLLDNLKV